MFDENLRTNSDSALDVSNSEGAAVEDEESLMISTIMSRPVTDQRGSGVS